ncbi:MAG: hypothetical protein JXA06_06515 [Bacteroidetes bacterium]|nr:hypothetical protein [Bacteroidota bacterium]
MASKKKSDPIYSLNIFHVYDEKTKRNITIFLVQTIRIFVSFRYEILLENEIIENEIRLHIKGLHVPDLLMPQTGPAQGRCNYEKLEGLYNLVVIKQDKTVNEFSIRISSTSVEILKKPKVPFIGVSNEPVNLL